LVLVSVNPIGNIFVFSLGQPLSLGPQSLANLYENEKGFEQKNPKNSFCFKLIEIFTLTEPHVVVVNKK
jgi:hypothetical protein